MRLRKKLSKNKLLKKIYQSVDSKIVPYLVKKHPVTASKYVYYKILGRKLNLKNPTDFNEKLQWLKNYWKNDLIIKCTDKYEVRNYIIEQNCGEILNELYGVYNSVEEIDWESLPNKFALKGTHGCGYNIICDNKDELDINLAKTKLNNWMKEDYSLKTAEFHYGKIKPRIICEKYIETDAGLLPNDYKIYCFNGVPKLVLVATERDKTLKLDFLDLEWNRLDIATPEYNKGPAPKKPDNFNEMIKYAEKLSKPFPFVRVDFYDLNNKVIFGEMTFTPAGCQAKYYNQEGLKYLGDMLELPKEKS